MSDSLSEYQLSVRTALPIMTAQFPSRCGPAGWTLLGSKVPSRPALAGSAGVRPPGSLRSGFTRSLRAPRCTVWRARFLTLWNCWALEPSGGTGGHEPRRARRPGILRVVFPPRSIKLWLRVPYQKCEESIKASSTERVFFVELSRAWAGKRKRPVSANPDGLERRPSKERPAKLAVMAVYAQVSDETPRRSFPGSRCCGRHMADTVAST